MAFRDNRDALLARSDALQKENDRLERDLASAAGERDELRRALEANQKALAKMRKQLARVERAPDAAARMRVTLLLAGVAVMALVGIVVWIILATAPQMVGPVEPTQPAGDVRSPPPSEQPR